MTNNNTVIVYSTPTCPYCRQVKEFLAQNNIAFVDKNVATDLSAREEMKTKSNSLGVPVIDVNGTILVGFNRGKLQELLGISA